MTEKKTDDVAETLSRILGGTWTRKGLDYVGDLGHGLTGETFNVGAWFAIDIKLKRGKELLEASYVVRNSFEEAAQATADIGRSLGAMMRGRDAKELEGTTPQVVQENEIADDTLLRSQVEAYLLSVIDGEFSYIVFLSGKHAELPGGVASRRTVVTQLMELLTPQELVKHIIEASSGRRYPVWMWAQMTFDDKGTPGLDPAGGAVKIVTAIIRGRGKSSTLPDNPTAVNADIHIDGEFAFGVTLVGRSSRGRLRTWGGMGDWCSDPAALERSGVCWDDVEHAVIRANRGTFEYVIDFDCYSMHACARVGRDFEKLRAEVRAVTKSMPVRIDYAAWADAGDPCEVPVTSDLALGELSDIVDKVSRELGLIPLNCWIA